MIANNALNHAKARCHISLRSDFFFPLMLSRHKEPMKVFVKCSNFFRKNTHSCYHDYSNALIVFVNSLSSRFLSESAPFPLLGNFAGSAQLTPLKTNFCFSLADQIMKCFPTDTLERLACCWRDDDVVTTKWDVEKWESRCYNYLSTVGFLPECFPLWLVLLSVPLILTDLPDKCLSISSKASLDTHLNPFRGMTMMAGIIF